MLVKVREKHRLLAYRIDRKISMPPEGSPAEKWVKTGRGNHSKWDNLALALARYEFIIIYNIDNWNNIVDILIEN